MDKVRFGLVGTGRITDWVLRGAREDCRFEAVAVCSRSASKGETFAKEHAIPLVYTDLEQMTANPDIDAVYIGTPNHTHADIALRCIAAGKHVLCEKPFTSNAKEARVVVRAAKEKGVVLMEAMISTLSPNFREVARRLPGCGRIGQVSMSFCQYSSKYEALQRGEVAASFDPRCGGGALMDLGVYTIWPVVALFGRPEKLLASIGTYDIPGIGPTDVQGTVLLEYKEFTAMATYSKTADSFLPSEISGERGAILLDKVHICRSLKWYPHAAPTSGRGEGAKAEDITVKDTHDEYYCEFKEFIDCVLEGHDSLINSPETSVIVMEVLDEVRKQAGLLAMH